MSMPGEVAKLRRLVENADDDGQLTLFFRRETPSLCSSTGRPPFRNLYWRAERAVNRAARVMN